MRPKRLILIAAVATALLLGGCISSQASLYERQLSAVIRADDGADENVAMAFGLKPRQPVAVTAIRDE
jgi:hypothetical protein